MLSPSDVFAQAPHPAQRAVDSTNAEIASKAEVGSAKQSLESLIAPIVRDAVQAELKSADAANPGDHSMDQTRSAEPFAT